MSAAEGALEQERGRSLPRPRWTGILRDADPRVIDAESSAEATAEPPTDHSSLFDAFDASLTQGVAASAGKRFVDVMLGSVLLVVAAPVIIVLAAVLAVRFRDNPFFVQERVGRGGRPLRFLKLRTLPPQAPRYADKYELEVVEIPRFCQFLRNYHLDELPQIALVISGHMSLVGPRPEMPVLHNRMEREHATARLAIRPGSTGLWQVGADADKLILESPIYDIYCAQNKSLRLDAWILWRTFVVCLGLGPGARIQDVPAWTRPRSARVSDRRSAARLPLVPGAGAEAKAGD